MNMKQAKSLMSGPPSRIGWIYVIRNDSANAVKIGFSTSPLRRLAQLQTASPSPLWIVAMIYSSQAFETLLHNSFGDRRMSGEWFDDSDGHVSEIVKLASRGDV
jgi:hypothetical protein